MTNQTKSNLDTTEVIGENSVVNILKATDWTTNKLFFVPTLGSHIYNHLKPENLEKLVKDLGLSKRDFEGFDKSFT